MKKRKVNSYKMYMYKTVMTNYNIYKNTKIILSRILFEDLNDLILYFIYGCNIKDISR